MANIKPGEVAQNPPKLITKTIIVEYNLGAYSGLQNPPGDIFEEKYTLDYPSGDYGTLAGILLQPFVVQEVASGDTDSYDASIWSQSTDNFEVMIRRTDENAAWSDDLQITCAFFYE